MNVIQNDGYFAGTTSSELELYPSPSTVSISKHVPHELSHFTGTQKRVELFICFHFVFRCCNRLVS